MAGTTTFKQAAAGASATTDQRNRLRIDGEKLCRLVAKIAQADRVIFACRLSDNDLIWFADEYTLPHASFLQALFDEVVDSGQNPLIRPIRWPGPQSGEGRDSMEGLFLGLALDDEAGGSGAMMGIFRRGTRVFNPYELQLMHEVRSIVTSVPGSPDGHIRQSAAPASSMLYESNPEFLAAVVRNSADEVFVLEPSGLILFESRSGCRRFEPDGESLVKRSFSDTVHPADANLYWDTLKKTLNSPGETLSPVELRIRFAGETWRTLVCVFTNTVDDPRIGGIIVNCHDISDSKSYEAQLVAAREKAEEMSRLKTTFLTNMSHEIRTPLTGVLGFAGLLMRELEGEHLELAEMIESSAMRLMNALNSILDLAQLETSRMAMRIETLDVVREIQDILGLLRAGAEKKKLFVKFESSEPELIGRLDRTFLGRVVYHLIENAVKYTDQGGITIRIQATERLLTATVSDTGAGMPQEVLNGILDELNTGAQTIDGSGLGLAITRRFVGLMRGRITVASETDVGTSFTLTLPRYFSLDENDDAERAAEKHHISSKRTTKPKILVVDDSQISRLLLRRLLSTKFAVNLASSHDEAVRQLMKNRFQLVLLDVNLGAEKSGFDVLQELKTLPGHQETCVIAITAFALPGDKERLLEAGFDDYLAKPYTRQELTEIVQKNLNR